MSDAMPTKPIRAEPRPIGPSVDAVMQDAREAARARYGGQAAQIVEQLRALAPNGLRNLSGADLVELTRLRAKFAIIAKEHRQFVRTEAARLIRREPAAEIPKGHTDHE